MESGIIKLFKVGFNITSSWNHRPVIVQAPRPLYKGVIEFVLFGNKGGDEMFFLERVELD